MRGQNSGSEQILYGHDHQRINNDVFARRKEAYDVEEERHHQLTQLQFDLQQRIRKCTQRTEEIARLQNEYDAYACELENAAEQVYLCDKHDDGCVRAHVDDDNVRAVLVIVGDSGDLVKKEDAAGQTVVFDIVDNYDGAVVDTLKLSIADLARKIQSNDH